MYHQINWKHELTASHPEEAFLVHRQHAESADTQLYGVGYLASRHSQVLLQGQTEHWLLTTVT